MKVRGSIDRRLLPPKFKIVILENNWGRGDSCIELYKASSCNKYSLLFEDGLD